MTKQDPTKLNWDNVPARFNYAATDNNGGRYFFSNKPYIKNGEWASDDKWGEDIDFDRNFVNVGNWTQTLIVRPSVKPDTIGQLIELIAEKDKLISELIKELTELKTGGKHEHHQ